MPKRKQEINPNSRKNLKTLCDELRITQKQLAKASGVSENTISKIATGKSPLTRQIAEEIIKVCPSYRIEWLLGFDNTPRDVQVIKIPGIDTAKRCLAVINLLDELGFSVGQVTDSAIFLPASEMGGFMFENKDVEIRYGNTVVWNGNIKAIHAVLLEICDFSLFKIEMLKKSMEV